MVVVDIIRESSSALVVTGALLAARGCGYCIAGSVSGLLVCVGTGGVGKSVADDSVILGKSSSSSCAVSGSRVDGLCRRSDARIQAAARALRSVRGGGMVMGVWGF